MTIKKHVVVDRTNNKIFLFDNEETARRYIRHCHVVDTRIPMKYNSVFEVWTYTQNFVGEDGEFVF